MNESPMILALETATSSCSVALSFHGNVLERVKIGNNVHSQVLLEMVRSVTEEANIAVPDIDVVAVGQGPGSFTGLRIGVGVGQGIAYGIGCPMIGVSSLDALAQQATCDGTILAALDARMGEVYWCEYQKAGANIKRSKELMLTPPEGVSVEGSSATLVGNAWQEYWPSFAPNLTSEARHLASVVYPHAASMLVLAEAKYFAQDWVAAKNFVPIYVRNNVAAKAR